MHLTHMYLGDSRGQLVFVLALTLPPCDPSSTYMETVAAEVLHTFALTFNEGLMKDKDDKKIRNIYFPPSGQSLVCKALGSLMHSFGGFLAVSQNQDHSGLSKLWG